MHETGAVARAVAALAATVGERPVRSITVGIGSDMHPIATVEAWRHAVSGGPLEGAVVAWVPVEDTLRCLVCAEDYAGDKLARCPSCDATGLTVEAAEGLTVLDWESEVGS